MSASHLIIYQNTSSQSVRPSVHVGCHYWTSRQHPPPPPQTHTLSPPLKLAADLVTFITVACVSEKVSVCWIMRMERWGTPGRWRDAKWNRWAEIEHCQKRLIISISFPKQTYCNQITYCNHCCIVPAACILYSLNCCHVFFFFFFLALRFVPDHTVVTVLV